MNPMMQAGAGMGMGMGMGMAPHQGMMGMGMNMGMPQGGMTMGMPGAMGMGLGMGMNPAMVQQPKHDAFADFGNFGKWWSWRAKNDRSSGVSLFSLSVHWWRIVMSWKQRVLE